SWTVARASCSRCRAARSPPCSACMKVRSAGRPRTNTPRHRAACWRWRISSAGAWRSGRRTPAMPPPRAAPGSGVFSGARRRAGRSATGSWPSCCAPTAWPSRGARWPSTARRCGFPLRSNVGGRKPCRLAPPNQDKIGSQTGVRPLLDSSDGHFYGLPPFARSSGGAARKSGFRHMNLIVKGQQIDVGDALRTHVHDSLDGVFDKYFGDAIDVTVIFSRDAHLFRAAVAAHVGRGIMAQSEATADQAYVAFDIASDRLAKRLRRHKRWLRDHHKLPFETRSAGHYVL